MKKGDIYQKHMRGSRFNFDFENIYYKFPNGNKSYVENNVNELLSDLIDVKEQPGRFRINEAGDITVYCQNCDAYIPKYVGSLSEELVFDGIDNNPKKLKPGNFWTGFVVKHGSGYYIDRSNKLKYSEFVKDATSENVTNFTVSGMSKTFIDKILKVKGETGKLLINEYGHVWTPVKLSRIQNGTVISDSDTLHEQFKTLSDKQKNIIRSYSEFTERKLYGKMESWYPIYVGKFTGQLNIKRKDNPICIHRLNDEEDF